MVGGSHHRRPPKRGGHRPSGGDRCGRTPLARRQGGLEHSGGLPVAGRCRHIPDPWKRPGGGSRFRRRARLSVFRLPPRTAQTLAEWQQATLSIAAFVDLALAATGTLMQVHEAGVIHGGLNPARLLIEPDGRVRLTGFAWASGTGGEAEGDLRLSGADMAYVAPELIRTDPAPVDARTDLYALGVLLYETLVGTLPITARDLQGWLHAQVAVEAPSTRLARADVPEVIDHILLKLISKDPSSATRRRVRCMPISGAWRSPSPPPRGPRPSCWPAGSSPSRRPSPYR